MFRLLETGSPQQFRDAAVEHILEVINAALHNHGSCIIGLSGGRSPRAVYEALGRMLCRAPHPGPLPRGEGTLHFFLVDERYVPPDHLESNQRMVQETLFERGMYSVPSPVGGGGTPLSYRSGRGDGGEGNIEARKTLSPDPSPFANGEGRPLHLLCPKTTLPIDDCIADYTRQLKELWNDRLPDLVILGMGTDGHTASLFPTLSALALSDEHLVLHTQAPKGVCCSASARDRITLSLNAIASAENVLLLLQGEEKKQVWEEMLASPEDERRWPLKRIIETGKLTVFAEW